MAQATFSRKNALDLCVWFESAKGTNWGCWSAYPELPVGANYLSYDTNKCQVNLSKTVSITLPDGDAETFDCITNGVPVGAKWGQRIGFGQLQRIFGITEDEIKNAIDSEKREKHLRHVRWQLDVAKRKLESGEGMPFMAAIENVVFKSGTTSDNYFSPIGKVSIIFPATAEGWKGLTFNDVVEWRQVRLQGRNGSSKKRVFVPVELPAHILNAIEAQIALEKLKRVETLIADIAKMEAELAA